MLSISFFRIPLLFPRGSRRPRKWQFCLSISFFRIPLLFPLRVIISPLAAVDAFNILFQDSSSVSQVWHSHGKQISSFQYPFSGFLFCFPRAWWYCSIDCFKEAFQYPFSGFLFCFKLNSMLKRSVRPYLSISFFRIPLLFHRLV